MSHGSGNIVSELLSACKFTYMNSTQYVVHGIYENPFQKHLNHFLYETK
jgi:hypothetical protein